VLRKAGRARQGASDAGENLMDQMSSRAVEARQAAIGGPRALIGCVAIARAGQGDRRAEDGARETARGAIAAPDCSALAPRGDAQPAKQHVS
jgi:hypothetical protein